MLNSLDSAFENMTRPLYSVALWPIRLAMASIFLYHGLGKFMMPEMAAMMGLSQPVWLLVATAEVLGGTGFIVGGFLIGGDAGRNRDGALGAVELRRIRDASHGGHGVPGLDPLGCDIPLLTGFARVTQQQADAALKPMGS